MRTDSIVQPEATTSPSLGLLALALSKAQGEIEGAKKDSSNPFFKSQYADLASVWDACHKSLSKNEICVVQTTTPDPKKVIVNTWLIHSSGEWMKSTLALTPKADDPQSNGSAITYARRFSLAMMVGVCPVDDDGNAASARVIDTSVPANKSQEANRLMAKPNPMIKPAA